MTAARAVRAGFPRCSELAVHEKPSRQMRLDFSTRAGKEHGVVEVVQVHFVEPRNGFAEEQVVLQNRISRTDGEKRERKRRDADGVFGNIAAVCTEREQHEGKFAHLAEIDGGQQAHAITLPQRIQHRKNRDEPAADEEQAEKNRPQECNPTSASEFSCRGRRKTASRKNRAGS